MITRLRPLQLLVAGIVAILFITPPEMAAAPDDFPGLQVKVAFFTSKIDEQKNYVEPGGISGMRLQRGPIYLWTKLTGTEETLKALQSNTVFPIWHEWTYVGTSGEVPDMPESSEHIYIGKISQGSALAAEVASMGIFDWRTWSGKRFLQYGRYQVRIMCGKGNTSKVLQCQGKECVYYFDYLP